MGIAAANLLQSRATLPDPRLVNCIIRPDVEEYAPWGFGQTLEMEARGRAAAEEVICQIKADCGR